MRSFVYDSLPGRVVFGLGAVDKLAEEVERLGASRALVLSTPGQRALAERAAAALGAKAVGVFDGAAMHVPIENANAGRERAKALAADCCVAVGGGSTVGLAKAIAAECGLPTVAVATTYSGSEMTPIWSYTEGGVKRTLRDPRVRPRTVIYDPALTVALPPRVSGPSGINAVAHCVEALYAEDRDPVTSLMAEEAIRALAASLPRVVQAPEDLEARSQALYGAWLAGAALAGASMGLHHKLCHTLGGSFDLPHAEVHTVILPHAAAYNRPAAPEAMARIARALGCEDGPVGLFELAQRVGAKVALADLGMAEGDLDRAAELATMNPYGNPRPVTRAGVRALLDDAYHGRRPGAAEGTK